MGLSCLTRNQGFAISDLGCLPWFFPFLASSREALAWLVLKSLPCCRRCWPMCAVSNAHDLWCWWCCGLPGLWCLSLGFWGRIRGSGRSPAYAITIELPKRQWQCPCEHRPAELGGLGGWSKVGSGSLQGGASSSCHLVTGWSKPPTNNKRSQPRRRLFARRSAARLFVRRIHSSPSWERSFSTCSTIISIRHHALRTLALLPRRSQRQTGIDRSRLGGWRVSCGP